MGETPHAALPPLACARGKQYRVISSLYPPIALFGGLVAAEDEAMLAGVESMTNDRLRAQIRQLSMVRPEDRVCGEGATVVMAAFTHISSLRPSRFSNGTFGVYYADRTLKTAITETRYHRERFMAATHEPPGEISMRAYVGEVVKPLHDLCSANFETIHDPDDWSLGQRMGKRLRNQDAWGVLYRSVRNPNGECIGAVRPPAVTIPRQGPHFGYQWDGRRITNVYQKRLLQDRSN